MKFPRFPEKAALYPLTCRHVNGNLPLSLRRKTIESGKGQRYAAAHIIKGVMVARPTHCLTGKE